MKLKATIKRINHITGLLSNLLYFWKASAHKYVQIDYYYLFKLSTCFISQEMEIFHTNYIQTGRCAQLNDRNISTQCKVPH